MIFLRRSPIFAIRNVLQNRRYPKHVIRSRVHSQKRSIFASVILAEWFFARSVQCHEGAWLAVGGQPMKVQLKTQVQPLNNSGCLVKNGSISGGKCFIFEHGEKSEKIWIIFRWSKNLKLIAEQKMMIYNVLDKGNSYILLRKSAFPVWNHCSWYSRTVNANRSDVDEMLRCLYKWTSGIRPSRCRNDMFANWLESCRKGLLETELSVIDLVILLNLLRHRFVAVEPDPYVV